MEIATTPFGMMKGASFIGVEMEHVRLEACVLLRTVLFAALIVNFLVAFGEVVVLTREGTSRQSKRSMSSAIPAVLFVYSDHNAEKLALVEFVAPMVIFVLLHKFMTHSK